MLNDFGLQSALVFIRQPTAALLTAAFWINVVLGLVVSGAVAALAVPLEVLSGVDGLAVPLAVAGLSFALSLGMVPTALLERGLKFGSLAFCEVTSQLAGTGFAIVGAAVGLGIYSLAGSLIVVNVVSSILLLCVAKYRPSGVPSLRGTRELWNFSSGMLGFAFVNYVVRNVDNFFLGRLSTSWQLGLYARGYSLALMPVGQVGLVVGRVLFPHLARLREAPRDLASTWARVVGPTLGATGPVLAGVAFGAADLTAVILPAAWSSLASIVVIMCLAGGAQVVASCFGCIYQAFGRTRLLFGLTCGQLLIFLAVIAPVAGRGATAVAWAVAGASWIYTPVASAVGLRLLRTSPSRLLAWFGMGAIGAASVGGAWYVAEQITTSGQSVGDRLARLSLDGLASVVIAACCALLIRKFERRKVASEQMEAV
jgi:O-antigen/teichoic acid export membrane protein